MSQAGLEQEARIALMDHFRSFAQYWGTILLTLAVAFLSLIQSRAYLPLELYLELLRMGLVVVVMEGIYALTRMVSHARLCWLTVSTKKKPETESERRMAYVSWLHETVINDLKREWRGLGRRLDALGRGRWFFAWTLTSVGIGLVFALILQLP